MTDNGSLLDYRYELTDEAIEGWDRQILRVLWDITQRGEYCQFNRNEQQRVTVVIGRASRQVVHEIEQFLVYQGVLADTNKRRPPRPRRR